MEKKNRYRLQAYIKKDLARRFIYKQNAILRSRTGWLTTRASPEATLVAMPARAPFCQLQSAHCTVVTIAKRV